MRKIAIKEYTKDLVATCLVCNTTSTTKNSFIFNNGYYKATDSSQWSIWAVREYYKYCNKF